MASLEVRKNHYRLVFWYHGKKFARSLKTKQMADAHLAKARLEDTLRRVELGTIAVPEDADLPTFLLSEGRVHQTPGVVEKDVTLTDLFNEFFDNLAPGTNELSTIYGMKIHRRHFERLPCGRIPLKALNVAELQKYVDQRVTEGVSATTIKKELVTLRRIWRWGGKRGKVKTAFPMADLEFPKTDERMPFMTRAEIERRIALGGSEELWDYLYLTMDEIEEVLNLVKVQARHDFIYPMFVFAAHTGARKSEMMRSEIVDLDFVEEMLTIRERKKSRAKRTTRRVPMTPLFKAVMAEWLKDRHPGGAMTLCHHLRVVRSRTKRKSVTTLTRTESHDHFQRTLAGTRWSVIKRWHCFRHSFISNLASSGVDQRFIDEWVGHLSEDMKRRYRHLLPSKQKEVLASVFGGR